MKRMAALLLLSLSLCGCARGEGALTVTVFEMGKADAILLHTENAAVLIDAGTNKGGDLLAARVLEKGVRRLDCVVLTHFDKDHVGGADKVLKALPVDRVLVPDYVSDSKQYRQYAQAASEAGVAPETVKAETAFDLDGVSYTVLPAGEPYSEENDLSLVVLAVHGQSRALFAGDCENPRLEALTRRGGLQADLLKVPHHGDYERMLAPFLDEVMPVYAVLTDSDDEPADERVTAMLEEMGAEVFSTRDGETVFKSAGAGFAPQ